MLPGRREIFDASGVDEIQKDLKTRCSFNSLGMSP